MKRCIIKATPEALQAVLGLPPDAVVESVRTNEFLGVLEMRISGFGEEVAQGGLLPTTTVFVRQMRLENGDLWYQAVPEVMRNDGQCAGSTKP